MIKIEITYNQEHANIKMTGHANYDKHGKDIVCAAASFLGQTINNELYRLDHKVKTKINENPSLLEISNIGLNTETKIILDYYENAVLELKKSYPNNIKVIIK